MAEEQSEPDIRREMAEILDHLAELGDDELDDRLRLNARLDELRSMLQAVEIEGAAEITARWSERAGSKPDDDPERSQIPSPSDPGGSMAAFG